MDPSRRNAWLRRGAIALALAIAWLAITVDDWSRDLTAHEAELTDDAYPVLQRRLARWSAEEAVAGVKMAARRIPSWRWVGDASDGDTTVVTFVRSGRLLRFTDDVAIRVESGGGRPRVSGRSEARLSIGDLGRNPRNLHLLFSELAAILEPGEQAAPRPVLQPPPYLRR